MDDYLFIEMQSYSFFYLSILLTIFINFLVK